MFCISNFREVVEQNPMLEYSAGHFMAQFPGTFFIKWSQCFFVLPNPLIYHRVAILTMCIKTYSSRSLFSINE